MMEFSFTCLDIIKIIFILVWYVSDQTPENFLTYFDKGTISKDLTKGTISYVSKKQRRLFQIEVLFDKTIFNLVNQSHQRRLFQIKVLFSKTIFNIVNCN